MRGLFGDRGEIVIGWFTKIILVLAVVSVLGYEATSIGVGHVRAQDLAKSAARAGSKEWQASRDVQRAYRAAESVAAGKAATIAPNEFVIAPDGTVTVTVEKEASSLLLHRIGATRRWVKIRETATGKFVV